MKFGIIYIATSPSRKCYVGKTTKDLRIRKRDHIGSSRNKNSPLYDTKFYRALRKYGDDFIWKEICHGNNEEELSKLEKKFILQFDSFKNGYNSTLGGEGACGRKCSEKTKRRLSDVNRGIKRNFSDEHRESLSKSRAGVKNPMYGRKHSEQWKRNVSEKLRSKNNPMYGKKLSDETKGKLSKAHKGKKLSKETKEKISKNHARHMLGKTHTDDVKEIIADANIGNQNRAKKYLITYPNGKEKIIFNLALFCRENGLNRKCMVEVAAGRNKRHRGYKVKVTN